MRAIIRNGIYQNMIYPVFVFARHGLALMEDKLTTTLTISVSRDSMILRS